MNVLFRLSLVLLIVASGISLGAARGQARVAGAVELCAGATMQVQLIDERGQPVTHIQICPDMALSLMTAVDVPAPEAAARQGGVWSLDPVPSPVLLAGRAIADARARGPPGLV